MGLATHLVNMLAVGFALAIGQWLTNLQSYIGPPPDFQPSDSSCNLLGQAKGMIGSEDLALAKHSILLITSGDLGTVFSKGAEAANPGNLWALDMRDGGGEEPVKIPIFGFPTGRRFQPHGFDVSNRTDNVYVISHNGDHSSVEIFNIRYRTDCLTSLPWSCPPVQLVHIHTLASNLFPNSGINDVAEAGKGEVYVTQWQPFPLPTNGMANPDSWQELLQVKALLPITLGGLKLTSVFHCRWGDPEEEDSCKIATDRKFLGANGLTISGNGKAVLVNDPMDKKITVFGRQDDGMLKFSETIPLPVAIDQIEWDDESGEVMIGTIPHIRATDMMDNSATVPGGAATLKLNSTGDWEWKGLLDHDGTKLSQVSAAAKLGKKLVLGSPVSEGILVCAI